MTRRERAIAALERGAAAKAPLIRLPCEPIGRPPMGRMAANWRTALGDAYASLLPAASDWQHVPGATRLQLHHQARRLEWLLQRFPPKPRRDIPPRPSYVILHGPD